MPNEAKRVWYTMTKPTDRQGSVADEQTGRTIAVTHDPLDAPIVAAAPEMYEALEAFLRAPSSGSNGPGSVTIEVQTFNLNAARAALAKAKGNS